MRLLDKIRQEYAEQGIKISADLVDSGYIVNIKFDQSFEYKGHSVEKDKWYNLKSLHENVEEYEELLFRRPFDASDYLKKFIKEEATTLRDAKVDKVVSQILKVERHATMQAQYTWRITEVIEDLEDQVAADLLENLVSVKDKEAVQSHLDLTGFSQYEDYYWLDDLTLAISDKIDLSSFDVENLQSQRLIAAVLHEDSLDDWEGPTLTKDQKNFLIDLRSDMFQYGKSLIKKNPFMGDSEARQDLLEFIMDNGTSEQDLGLLATTIYEHYYENLPFQIELDENELEEKGLDDDEVYEFAIVATYDGIIEKLTEDARKCMKKLRS